jgi:putative ABC transport system permease protein
LATTVELLPPIFLTVAAFLLNIVLARLVDTEREVIGLMKAFGYSNAVVMAHYAGLALLLAAGGLILGSILGTWLGHAVATMYQQYFVFPFLNFRAGADSYLIGLAATITAALIGAAISVRRAARLTPAEAMRPPSPPDYSGRWTSALAKRLGPDEPTRVVLRNLLRRPLRMTMTVIGLSSALALYIASASATDNIDKMIDLAFGRAERADLVVTFAEPRDARVIYELARMPGIMRVESFRAVGAKLIAGHHAVREALTSSTPGSDLSRLVDLNGRVVEPPPAGVIITSRMARQLNIRAGQHLSTEVTEGQRPQIQFNVSQVIDTPLGSSARLSKSALNRLMREGNVASGAYLQVDPLFREQIYRQLKNTPQIASVMSEAAIIQGVRDTVAQQMGIVTLFNTGLAALIVLGVVYNSARISLSEQARDLASMRVLGFRRGETAFVLLGELALLVLMSLPIGIAMGISLSRYVAERFSADLYTIPFGIHVATLAEGTLVVMAAALVTSLVIRIRVDNLDLVQALKTRE